MILIKCGSYNEGTYWGVIEGEINEEWIKQISGAIKSYPNYWNWTNDTKLKRKDDGEWVDVKKVYDMYPTIDPEVLDWFASFLPARTERIDEVRIIEIKHEDSLL